MWEFLEHSHCLDKKGEIDDGQKWDNQAEQELCLSVCPQTINHTIHRNKPMDNQLTF